MPSAREPQLNRITPSHRTGPSIELTQKPSTTGGRWPSCGGPDHVAHGTWGVHDSGDTALPLVPVSVPEGQEEKPCVPPIQRTNAGHENGGVESDTSKVKCECRTEQNTQRH